MLNILIPCAGVGRRFQEAGYTDPKPLIDANGKPMLKRVVDNICPDRGARWIFISRFGVLTESVVKSMMGRPRNGPQDFRIIDLDHETDGAARTCLTAKWFINNGDPLLIANCDQLVEGIVSGGNPRNVGDIMARPADDASVLTFLADGSTRWSYASVYRRLVQRVAEKVVISDRATCGYYWFRRGKDFIVAAEKMIAANDRTNGEFYVAPALNYMIAEGFKVRDIRCEDYGATFHGLGTPEDLRSYLEKNNMSVARKG